MGIHKEVFFVSAIKGNNLLMGKLHSGPRTGGRVSFGVLIYLEWSNLVRINIFGFRWLLDGQLPNLATRDEFMCITFAVSFGVTFAVSFGVTFGVTICDTCLFRHLLSFFGHEMGP